MSPDTRAEHSRRWLILATVAGCFLPVAADATILNVAVPSLTETLGASAREVLWIADIYPLVMVGLVLITGPLGDRVGHQRLLLLGLGVFGVSSGLSALATTPEALIAGRAALAVGAAMIIPATLAIIRQVFHDTRERAVAIGVWSAIAASGAAVGPVAGGLLLEHFWWGSAFLINIPVVVAALLLVGLLLSNRPAKEKEPWEAASPVLAVAGIVGVVYAVKSAAQEDGALAGIVVPGLIGLLASLLFVRRQLRSAHPMLDMRLFRERHFRAGVIASVLPVFVLVGFELQLAQHLQFVIGMSPGEAGLFLLPMPVAAFAAAPLVGFFSSRLALSTVVSGGLGLAGLGYAGIALSAADSTSPALTGCLILIGAGHGAVQAVASDAIMTGAPEHRAGAAASVESVSYEVGAGLGIALLGSLMAALYGRSFTLPSTVSADVPDKASDSIGEAVHVAGATPGEAGRAIASAAKDAFISAYQVTTVAAAAIVTVTAVATALTLRGSTSVRPEETEPTPQKVL
ncbi:MFS transporter [Streptomyces amakusaensis]|uniref:MFS transporter n=1 Tax=Streptomyces amakusaensis TaxID=67271 RepID=A0ABW0AI13_9ACTN